VPRGAVPAGFLRVIDAYDGEDRPVTLVHEGSAPLRRMAVFDVLVNNADRKGGHVLAMPDGHRLGVDHGVSFHVQNKLRTVLWGWREQPLTDDEVASILRVRDAIDDSLGATLAGMLADEEIAALVARCDALLRAGALPVPSGEWPSIPWPAF
jgi:uncharacterized repeat protein (TIGR03843 family)